MGRTYKIVSELMIVVYITGCSAGEQYSLGLFSKVLLGASLVFALSMNRKQFYRNSIILKYLEEFPCTALGNLMDSKVSCSVV